MLMGKVIYGLMRYSEPRTIMASLMKKATGRRLKMSFSTMIAGDSGFILARMENWQDQIRVRFTA